MELGWIDFSKKDRQKALDVMELLHEQGALDELGIGIVRDAFSNHFFPGTSTVQTRAKYFLIVPYALKEAVEEGHGNSISQVLKDIDNIELACGKIFVDEYPNEDGIIGRRVLPSGWVARKPSDIYWNGIQTYGIFTNKELSIREYVAVGLKQKNNIAKYAAGNNGTAFLDADKDDADAGAFRPVQFWNLPTYTKDWKNKEKLQINLTKPEAEFLKKQIIDNTKSTLLAYILSNNVDINAYDSFDTLTKALSNDVDEHMAYTMQLACDFSNLVYMARVRYNMILSKGTSEDAQEEWKYLEENRERYASVDLDVVFKELNIANSKTYLFLSAIKECFLNNEISKADECIRKREIQLKGTGRAKLYNPEKYYSPSHPTWVGGRRLDYRYPDAKRIINDIYVGEVSQNV